MLYLSFFLARYGLAIDHRAPADSSCCMQTGQGWSLDLGGQYTWMSFTSPPTFNGNTGGAHGSITYQKPNSFFGQIRSIYNIGTLTSRVNSAKDTEWYTELLGGYSFLLSKAGCPFRWTMTPYAGLGLDFLNDHRSAYASIAAIKLKYQLYYALVGFDIRYANQNWSIAAQGECFPTFQEYLSIPALRGAAWKMNQRVGFAVRLPVAYRLVKDIWLEAAPYYRLLPIGASSVLSLPSRNLHQWGIFATFRFFI